MTTKVIPRIISKQIVIEGKESELQNSGIFTNNNHSLKFDSDGDIGMPSRQHCSIYYTSDSNTVTGVAATGLIVNQDGGNTTDGDYFMIYDGVNNYVFFIFDDNGSVVEDQKNRQIAFTGAETEEQIRDLIIAAINNAPVLNINATVNGVDPNRILITNTITGQIGNVGLGSGFIGGQNPVGNSVALSDDMSGGAGTISLFNTTDYGGAVSILSNSGILYDDTRGTFRVQHGGKYKIEITGFLKSSSASTALINVWDVQAYAGNFIDSLSYASNDPNGGDRRIWSADTNTHGSVDPVERTVSIIVDLKAGDYVRARFQAHNTANSTITKGTTLNIYRFA